MKPLTHNSIEQLYMISPIHETKHHQYQQQSLLHVVTIVDEERDVL